MNLSGNGLTEVPGFEIPPVEDLLWGQTVSGALIEGQKNMSFTYLLRSSD